MPLGTNGTSIAFESTTGHKGENPAASFRDCPVCSGSGSHVYANTTQCYNCGGSGTLPKVRTWTPQVVENWSTKGKGK